MSQKRGRICSIVFRSRFGWFGVVWNGQEVAKLTFGHPSRRAAMSALGKVPDPVASDGCPDPSLVTRLQAYAEGEYEDFSDVAVETAHLTPFGRRVLKACRAIPYGKTASYAALADQAGSPKAARAVGQWMAANRVPLIVPCHRVVGAGGRLGGFSAPGGTAVKQRLLDLEGADD